METRIGLDLGGEHRSTGMLWAWDPSMEDARQGGRQSPVGEHSMAQGLCFTRESCSSKLNPSEHLAPKASCSKEDPRDEHH